MVEDDEDDVTDQHAGGDAVHIEKIKPVVDEAVSVPGIQYILTRILMIITLQIFMIIFIDIFTWHDIF